MLNLLEFYVGGAIAIIGIIEWIKHLDIEFINKRLPYLSLLLSIAGGLCAATQDGFTWWKLFMYVGGLLATVQLGYQSLVESIGGAINKFLTGEKNS